MKMNTLNKKINLYYWTNKIMDILIEQTYLHQNITFQMFLVKDFQTARKIFFFFLNNFRCPKQRRNAFN